MTQYETKDSGAREKFASGMQRDTEAGKPRFDLLIPEGVPFEDQLLTRFALLMGRGAEKYEDRNWEQADSEAEIARAKSSAFRHFMQWFCGERDEDHAAAVMFNLLVVETTEPKVGRDDSSYYAEVADKLLGNHREPWQPGDPGPVPPNESDLAADAVEAAGISGSIEIHVQAPAAEGRSVAQHIHDSMNRVRSEDLRF